MKNDLLEASRVSVVGTIGFVASLSLSDVATLTSIAVGLATLVYVVTKTVFLIRRQGKDME
jgi:hypothetical protein